VIRINASLGDGHTSIEVDGHEGHTRGGVVCAAVSAIVQTALLGLQEIARQNPDLVSLHIKEKDR
jgi:uncharacterized protein YsxB (DUF464 family)